MFSSTQSAAKVLMEAHRIVWSLHKLKYEVGTHRFLFLDDRDDSFLISGTTDFYQFFHVYSKESAMFRFHLIGRTKLIDYTRRIGIQWSIIFQTEF